VLNRSTNSNGLPDDFPLQNRISEIFWMRFMKQCKGEYRRSFPIQAKVGHFQHILANETIELADWSHSKLSCSDSDPSEIETGRWQAGGTSSNYRQYRPFNRIVDIETGASRAKVGRLAFHWTAWKCHPSGRGERGTAPGVDSNSINRYARYKIWMGWKMIEFACHRCRFQQVPVCRLLSLRWWFTAA